MQTSPLAENDARHPLLVRIGIPPAIAWGYLGRFSL